MVPLRHAKRLINAGAKTVRVIDLDRGNIRQRVHRNRFADGASSYTALQPGRQDNPLADQIVHLLDNRLTAACHAVGRHLEGTIRRISGAFQRAARVYTIEPVCFSVKRYDCDTGARAQILGHAVIRVGA